jgi:hypothetical protein
MRDANVFRGQSTHDVHVHVYPPPTFKKIGSGSSSSCSNRVIIRFYVNNNKLQPHLRITLKKLARTQADTVESSFRVLKDSIQSKTFPGKNGEDVYELTLQNVRPSLTTVDNRTDTKLTTGKPEPFHEYIHKLIPLITTTNEIAPGDSANAEAPTSARVAPEEGESPTSSGDP